MKELQKDIKTIELTRIIRSLMHFIVIEGKDFVSEKDKKAYIKSYLYTFTKSINGMNDFVNMKVIHDQIEDDIIFGNDDSIIE